MSDKELIKQEIERRIAEGSSKNYISEGALALESLLDFIDSLPEESASEDLEEYYTKEFLPKEWFAKPGHRTISQFNFFTARHFAEWQKQKMMKDVFIDDYIVHDGRIELEADPLPSVEPIILLPYPKFKPNDKVKIIIVKEEQ